MAFFPFMIQMQDKLCVIGGGGKVAYRKVSMMLSFGARVTVIAPKICDELQKIESKQDTLLLVQRPFEDGDKMCIRDRNKSESYLSNWLDEGADAKWAADYIREQSVFLGNEAKRGDYI